MKAIVIERFGGPKVLKLREMPKPEPREGQLLIRVNAAGVNPVDVKIRQGRSARAEDLPLIVGADAAGVVEAIGPQVSLFQTGEEVFGFTGLGKRGGTYAEYALLDERLAARKPEEISFVDAASLPIAAITAWESLYHRANIESGQTVLIHAGAGGVGSLAIQLAKLRDATVIVTASLPEHIEFCRRLGADHVIDYKKIDFIEAVMDLTGGRGVPAIMDNVGGETFTRSFDALAPGGQIVTIVERGPVDTLPLFLKSATLHLEFMGAAINHNNHPERQGRILGRVAQLAAGGKIRTTVFQVLPLEKAADAHKAIETGHVMGKIVLEVENRRKKNRGQTRMAPT